MEYLLNIRKKMINSIICNEDIDSYLYMIVTIVVPTL